MQFRFVISTVFQVMLNVWLTEVVNPCSFFCSYPSLLFFPTASWKNLLWYSFLTLHPVLEEIILRVAVFYSSSPESISVVFGDVWVCFQSINSATSKAQTSQPLFMSILVSFFSEMSYSILKKAKMSWMQRNDFLPQRQVLS